MLLFVRQLFMMRARASVCVCVCVCVRACVCMVHLYCSAQLSMFDMEKRYGNKIIIIIIIINIMTHVRPVGHLSVRLAWQKLERWTLIAHFSKHFFSYLSRIGTIDFYPLIPLDLAWGHKVSTKQNVFALFSLTLFN